MRPIRTATALAFALVAVSLAPAVAQAKPVSTYLLESSHVSGMTTTSLDLVVAEDGSSVVHLQRTEVGFATCSGVTSVSTTLVTANDSVAPVAFGVDRKLASFEWTGVVEVSVAESACGQTVTSVEVWTLHVVGTSSDRLSRSRIDGTRTLTSTLSPLAVSASTWSYDGVGLLTESIARS